MIQNGLKQKQKNAIRVISKIQLNIFSIITIYNFALFEFSHNFLKMGKYFNQVRF